MKIKLMVLTLILVAFPLLSKERYYAKPFEWNSPEILAQGGSFIANGKGFGSLLVNPASFDKSWTKNKKDGSVKTVGEITLLSVDASWSGDIFDLRKSIQKSDSSLVEFLLDQITSEGLGAYPALGFGYVGRGFGFGLIASASLEESAFKQGNEQTADLDLTAGLILGYAHSLNLGPLKLVPGADIRPMYRMVLNDIDSDIIAEDSKKFENLDFSSVDAYKGFAIAFDFGLDVIWKGLAASVTMRDIGNTRFFYEPLDKLHKYTFSGNKPEHIYVVPWTVNAGLAYNPRLGRINNYVDPTIHASISQPLVMEDSLENYKNQAIWTKVNGGAEILLLTSVALRAGFKGGCFTTGFGLDLFFLELNGALYSQKPGDFFQDKSEMAGSLELAIRF